MNLSALLRRALPHLVVIALFLGAISLYFSPLVFKGYSLKQSDAAQWTGSAREIVKFREQYHQEPLWTNGMFSGMPAYTVSVLYPGEWVPHIEEALRIGLPYPASILLVALLCYYILMLALGQKPPAAALGAVAFTFFTFSFISIEAGHNSKVRAMAMAPMLLAGVVLMYRDKRLAGFALAALGMAMNISAGHYQITYYLALFCAFLGVGLFIKALQEKKLPAFAAQTGLLLVAVALGVGANASRLLVMQEYAPYSMRGKSELTPKSVLGEPAGKSITASEGGLDRDYVFNWSNEKMETFTLIIPSFRGGSSLEPINKKGEVAKYLQSQNYDVSSVQGLPLYWGDLPSTSGPVYAGAIVIFLLILALFVLPISTSGWLVAAVLFSIVLTWGKHFEGFNYFMYDHFPAYRQFRSVTMAIVIAQWAMPWLGVLALGKFLDEKEPMAHEKKLKALYWSGGIVGGFLLLFGLIPSLAGSFETPNDAQLQNPGLVSALVEERAAILSSDAWRSLVLALLAAGLLFGAIKTWLKPSWVVIGLALITLADLWQINSRYLNKSNFEKNFIENRFVPSAADQRMMSALPYHEYRVLNLQNFTGETQTSYFHQSLGGYSPAKLRRYQDLIEGPLAANMDSLARQLSSGRMTVDSAFAQAPVLNMLNARFLKYGDEANQVIENPKACGTAWFVEKVDKVNSADEEYEALSKPGFNPSRTALIDQSKFKLKADAFSTAGASVKIKTWKSNEIVYEASNPAYGLLVLSENYYPKGWTATVDGKEAEIMRADYTLRALELPAGKHEVVLRFDPLIYSTGNLISTISSALIYAVLAFGLFMAYKAYQKERVVTPAV